MTKTNPENTTIDINAEIEARAVALMEAAIGTVLANMRSARGTGDHTEAAQAAAASVPVAPSESEVLHDRIKELVSERPMRFREILEATKCTENQLKGTIVKLQRDRVGLVNLGNQAKALWFIPNEELLERLRKGNIVK